MEGRELCFDLYLPQQLDLLAAGGNHPSRIVGADIRV
jgi:hypothetical protein